MDELEEKVDGHITTSTYTIEETLMDLRNTTDKFYKLVDSRPDVLVYLHENDNSTEIRKPKMTVELYRYSIRDATLYRNISYFPIDYEVHYLTEENPIGIFGNKSDTEIRLIFDRLREFRVEMEIQSLDWSLVSPYNMGRCVQWKILVGSHQLIF